MGGQEEERGVFFKKRVVVAASVALLAVAVPACGSDDTGGAGSNSTNSSASSGGGDGKIKLGFAQVGAESGWRTANTTSIQDSAKQAGIDLKFSDAQQKQENQIKAIRSYIQQKVDVIAFSPVVESGWDAVLNEAKRAQIPVILTDRAVDSKDTSLYKTFLGSDFVKEGNEAGEWAVKEFADAKEVNIAELQGTTGSAPAVDRKQGFTDVISKDPKFKITQSQTGEFTRAKGKEVMEAFLKSGKKIDLLFAHNDDMALGAIEAIEGAGMKPGTDIKIVSIDAVKDGMQALADGKINFLVECNPLLGPQLMDLVKKVKAGQEVPARVETEEGTFTQDQAKTALPDRKY
jgi:ABC-type sugar transport system substrate-binding protein